MTLLSERKEMCRFINFFLCLQNWVTEIAHMYSFYTFLNRKMNTFAYEPFIFASWQPHFSLLCNCAASAVHFLKLCIRLSVPIRVSSHRNVHILNNFRSQKTNKFKLTIEVTAAVFTQLYYMSMVVSEALNMDY